MALELDELDPDLVLDMPEQHTGGLFGIRRSDSLELGNGQLYAVFGDAMNSSGPLSPMRAELDPLGQLDPSHFSLADELAGAMSNDHRGIDNLMAELEEEGRTDGQEALDDESVSMITPCKSPRRLKSSKETSYSAVTNVDSTMQQEDDLSIGLEDGMVTLKYIHDEIEAFRASLKDQDTIASRSSGHASEDADARLEDLSSQVIRSIYETVKRQQEDIRDLKEMEHAIQQEMLWMGLTVSQDMRSQRDKPQATPGQSRLSSLQEESLDSGDEKVQQTGTAAFLPQDLIEALVNLRKYTEALAGSMSNINEHVQVNKAASTDTYRKLKAIEAAMGRLKTEAEAVDACQARIASWEAHMLRPLKTNELKQSAIPTKTRHGDFDTVPTIRTPIQGGAFQAEAKTHLSSALASLENAHAVAQSLLGGSTLAPGAAGF